MAEHLLNSGFLTDFQHGFTKGKSCSTNLLTAFKIWTKWVDEGYGVDIWTIGRLLTRLIR